MSKNKTTYPVWWLDPVSGFRTRAGVARLTEREEYELVLNLFPNTKFVANCIGENGDRYFFRLHTVSEKGDRLFVGKGRTAYRSNREIFLECRPLDSYLAISLYPALAVVPNDLDTPEPEDDGPGNPTHYKKGA